MRAVGAGLLGVAACSFHTSASQTGDGSAAADATIDTVDAPGERLVGRGLVARYLIAEAASGQSPIALVDEAASPLALPIMYTSSLQFGGATPHRALVWTAPSADGSRATAAIAGTKIAARLAGSATWTLEVVVDVQAIPPGIDCRMLAISSGTSNYGSVALLTSDLSSLWFYMNGFTGTQWVFTQNSGRHVIHAVFDSNQSDETIRERIYIDGVATARSQGTMPFQGTTLVLQSSDALTIGNVDTGDRSFIGSESYAAIYDVVLAPSEIAANAAALALDDDSP